MSAADDAGYQLVRAGAECRSADVKLGEFEGAEGCAAACRAADDCEYFIFGHGSKTTAVEPSPGLIVRRGWCWREYATATPQGWACAEGFQDDDYDFFQLRAPERVGSREAGYVLVRTGEECLSANTDLGAHATVAGCASACAARDGCRFFVVGTGGAAGACWQEQTLSVGCDEGWRAAEGDFYHAFRPSRAPGLPLDWEDGPDGLPAPSWWTCAGPPPPQPLGGSGQCFSYYAARLDWAGAERVCKQRGAHLARVETQARP
jgi:hypothetical protein